MSAGVAGRMTSSGEFRAYRCSMTWPEEFSHEYDQWTAGLTADIDFYVGLARETDGPIVELAIGSGRVAVPIALATGRPVIGVDTSPSMLDAARRRAEEADVELVAQLHDADGRQLGTNRWDFTMLDHPVNDFPVNDLPVNDLPVNDFPVNDFPVNDLPVNDHRADREAP